MKHKISAEVIIIQSNVNCLFVQEQKLRICNDWTPTRLKNITYKAAQRHPIYPKELFLIAIKQGLSIIQ
jgi:hypothetical protein